MKLTEYKNGASTLFERLTPSGLYLVTLRAPNGDLHDKVRCDSYRDAMSYLRAFAKIARNL